MAGGSVKHGLKKSRFCVGEKNYARCRQSSLWRTSATETRCEHHAPHQMWGAGFGSWSLDLQVGAAPAFLHVTNGQCFPLQIKAEHAAEPPAPLPWSFTPTGGAPLWRGMATRSAVRSLLPLILPLKTIAWYETTQIRAGTRDCSVTRSLV